MNTTEVGVSSITKRYPGVVALDDVSLAFGRGEVVGLVGENGAGKSTLTRVLAGLIPGTEYEGEVLVGDEPVAFFSPRDALASGIVLIPQELSLHPQLTVAENVVLGRWPASRLRTVSWGEVRAQAERFLATVRFSHDADRLLGSLAPSEQQLVAIARGLAREARLLLLDEPSAALDGPETERLLELVQSLAAGGVSVVYISHRLDEVFAVADRIVVLRNGKVVDETSRSNATTDSVVGAMLGRAPTPTSSVLGQGAIQNAESPILTARVSLDDPVRPGRSRLEEVDLSLWPGEIVGLVGLVGSGRTELLWSLFGALPRKGEVRVEGSAIGVRPSDAVRAGLGIVTEERRSTGLFNLQTLARNMSVASLDRLAGFLGKVSSSAEIRLAEDGIRTLNIKAPNARVPIATLSGGNQQKTVVGRWVMRDCSVLLLDEPARGIDVGSRAEIYALLRQLADERRIAILTTSSDISELVGVCDRFLVLREGRITAEVSGDEATEHGLLELAGGAAHILAPPSPPGRVSDEDAR